MEEAIAAHGTPEIVHSDQGTQCTSVLCTQYPEGQKIHGSMDAKVWALDNVWIALVWKSLKYA
ncbi:hypothetical protein KJS93_10450 [Flavihumibacter fluvii]|nr:hypothetical protein [Flavihumibacter fluvii]ULQ54738.1 hypothetical protein KJS93_10450 [Flavihumibacter fluvii]